MVTAPAAAAASAVRTHNLPVSLEVVCAGQFLGIFLTGCFRFQGGGKSKALGKAGKSKSVDMPAPAASKSTSKGGKKMKKSKSVDAE